MEKKQFKISKKAVNKTLKISFLTSLAVTTVGFTMFGIGAGGKSTGVTQISAGASYDQPLKDKVDEANGLLAKFKTNTGFLTAKGKKMTADQEAASKDLNNLKEVYKTKTSVNENEFYNKLNAVTGTIGDVEKYNKEVTDNKTFFNVGVTIFSLGCFALIATFAYWSFFRNSYNLKEKH